MNYEQARDKVMALFPGLHQHHCIIPKTKDGHTYVQMLIGGKDGEEKPLLLPKDARRYLIMFLPVFYWPYNTSAMETENCSLFLRQSIL